MAGEIQLGGNIKIGPNVGSAVDFSNFVSQMKVITTRVSVEIPGTLGQPRGSSKAGVTNQEVVISFFSDVNAAGLWAELWDIISTTSAEFYFEGNANTGVTGVDNPKFSGTATLLNLDTGNPVGDLRSNEVTCPVTSAGVTKAIA